MVNLLNSAKSLLLAAFLVWVASLGCSDSDDPGETRIVLQLVDERDTGDERQDDNDDDDRDDNDDDDRDDDDHGDRDDDGDDDHDDDDHDDDDHDDDDHDDDDHDNDDDIDGAINGFNLAFNNPEDAGRPSPSFAVDIQPILTNRCAFAGCHAARGQNGIDLRTYDSLRAGGEDGAIVIPGNARSSDLVEEIVSGRMPPGGPPLDPAQIQQIIDWVNEGAKDN